VFDVGPKGIQIQSFGCGWVLGLRAVGVRSSGTDGEW
jgi:hypothetical protein